MSSGDFWHNRRFNLDSSKDGINLDDASRRLNISKNQLSSIFSQSDTNQNGVLEAATDGGGELEQFLVSVNQTFTKFFGNIGSKAKEVSYDDAKGNSVAEEYDDDGKLIRKKVVYNNYVLSENSLKSIEYRYRNGYISELVERNGGEEKRTTFERENGKLTKTVTEVGNKRTTKLYSNGEVVETIVTQDNKFLEKSFKDSNGDLVHVSVDGENIVENRITKGAKNITVIYKGSYSDYESGKLNKIYESITTFSVNRQEDKIELKTVSEEVEYDGKGNTIVYAKAGDGWESIAKKFNISVSELKKLNPKTAKSNNIQAAQPIIIPGIISADSSVLKGRRENDRAKAIQTASAVEFNRATENIYSSAIDETVLTQNFGNAYNYANYLAVNTYLKKPNEPGFNALANSLANELRLLNGPDVKYNKGDKVKIIASRTQDIEKSLLEVYGFKPNEENAVFFTRFARLSSKERSDVMDVLELCRKNKITDKAKINKEIQRLCNGLNLFDTDIKTLTRPSDMQIRKVMAQTLLQQLMQIAAMYESANPQKDSFWDTNPFELAGAGFVEIYGAIKRKLSNINTSIASPDTGVDICRDIQAKIDMCLKLIGICEREEAYQSQSVEHKDKYGTNQFRYEYEQLYQRLTGERKIDYNGVANYLQISAEMSKLIPQQKIRSDVDGVTGASVPMDTEKYKQLEKELEKYQYAVNVPVLGNFDNRIQEWVQHYQQVGGLVEFGTTLAMLYVSGGFSAIMRGSAAAGSYASRGMSLSLAEMSQGKIGAATQSIIAQSVGIQAQLITNSAATATAFGISNLCKSASDFYIDEQEWEMMKESWTGLAEFTYVNGLFIGPAAQFVAKAVTGIANTEMAAKAILNNAVGKSTNFGKLMTIVLENAADIEKGIQMSLSFAMNMDFMAKTDNLTYKEAFNSLLQMEGVSKLVAGIMGQKGIKIPPEKVKTVSARINKYKVDIARFNREAEGGKKQELLIRVTSPEGKIVGEFKDFESFKNGMNEIIIKESGNMELLSGEENQAPFESTESVDLPNIENLQSQLKQDNVSYEIITDKNGNKLIRIVSSYNLDVIKGMTDIKYNVFVFDKDGKCVTKEKDIPKAELEKQYKDFHSRGAKLAIVSNSAGTTSGTAYVSILPPPPQFVKRYYQAVKDTFSSFFTSDEITNQPAKNMDELVQQARKLGGNNVSVSAIQEMLREIEPTEENLKAYSGIISTLKQNNASTGVLKDIIDYAKQEQKTPQEVNDLIQAIVSGTNDIQTLFSPSGYNGFSALSNILSSVKREKNMADVTKLLQIYTKHYGKQSNFIVKVVTSTKPENIDKAVRLIETYAADPEMRDVVNPAGGHIGLYALMKCNNEAEMVRRIKIMQKLVEMRRDNRDEYGKYKLDILQTEEPQVFDKYMQRLERIKNDISLKNDIYNAKELIHAYKLITLSDEGFENLYKRDLFDKYKTKDTPFADYYKTSEIAKYAEMPDEVYDRSATRGLDAETELNLVELTDEEYNKYLERGIGEKVINSHQRVFYSKLSDAEWDIVEKYKLFGLHIDTIEYLLAKGENDISILKQRGILSLIMKQSIREDLIDKYINMPDKEFQPVIDRKLTEIFPNRQRKMNDNIWNQSFSLEEIDALRQVSDKDWQRVQYLLTLDRGYIDLDNQVNWFGDVNYHTVQPFTVEDVLELAKLSDEDFEFLKNSGALNDLKMNSVRAFLDFKQFADVKDAKQMNAADNRRLASALLKNNALLFEEDLLEFIRKKYSSSILPQNQQQYCSLLSSAVRNGVFEVNPTTPEQQKLFEQSLSDMGEQNSTFLRTDLEAPDFKLEMEYPREEFMQDVMSALEGLSNSEKQKIMDYFGFEIYIKEGNLVLSGYPRVLESGLDLTSEQGKKVRKLVERFTVDNKISVNNNPELTKMLNDIFDTFPELKGIIGKVQHGMHDYTVDVHTLKVLQGVMSNPDFAALPPSDKKILTISTLMHDISKKEMDIDKQHPQNSATEASQLLSKMNLTQTESESIYAIIKHHDWLEQYNREGISPEERTQIAQHIAYALKDGNNFKLASMLAEADLKGVQRGNTFYNQYEEALNKGIKEISQYVNKVKSSEIYLPLTRIPHASELIADGDIIEEVEMYGYKVKVLHLRNGQDLSKVGFPSGTKSEDLLMLYHGCANEYDKGETSAAIESIEALYDINSDGVLSTSLFSTFNAEYYAPYGLIQYAPNSHLIAGAAHNIGAGRGGIEKTVDNMVDKYIYNDVLLCDREYFPNKMKEKLNLTDAQYIELYDKIAGMTKTELRESMPDVAAAMEEILYETEQERQKVSEAETSVNGKRLTEILLKMNNYTETHAVGCPSGSSYLSQMPKYFFRYAAEKDIVVVCGNDGTTINDRVGSSPAATNDYINKIRNAENFEDIFTKDSIDDDVTSSILKKAGFSEEEIIALRDEYSDKLNILACGIRELRDIGELDTKEDILEFLENNGEDDDYKIFSYINDKNLNLLMSTGNMSKPEALQLMFEITGNRRYSFAEFKDGIITAQNENIPLPDALEKNRKENSVILESVINDDYNSEIADKILDFKSTSEVFDCEYDNILSGLNKDGFEMMDILMKAANKGDNEFLQNIHNIRMIVEDLQQYFSVSDVAQIVNMKNSKGEPLLNRKSYDELARNKFKDINLPMSPEILSHIRDCFRERFENITDEDLVDILSNISDSKTASLIERMLTSRNSENGKPLYDLDMIEITAKYLNKHPDNADIIEMIHNKAQTFKNKDFYDKAYPEIIKMLENCQFSGEEIIHKLLKTAANNFSWRLIGQACHSINNCKNVSLAEDVAANLLSRYWENNLNLTILTNFKDETSIKLIQKMIELREADNSQTYTAEDIKILMYHYIPEAENLQQITEITETIIDNKLHVNTFETLNNLKEYDIKNGTHCYESAVEILKIKGKNGVHKFSANGVKAILDNLPKPVKEKHLNYVKSLIEQYPSITTKQILDNLSGKMISFDARPENPFGENGRFYNEYERIRNTDAYKKLSYEVQTQLFDYLSDLVRQDPNRFERLVNSGYFELCSQGKLNINDLLSNLGTRKFFSKNFLNDVSRMYSGEPLVKEYNPTTPLSRLALELDYGEVASVGDKLYVNDNGTMVQLKMTKEKFEELFPLESRFNSKQGALGDCWLVSALDELMDIPNGRAKLYQLFEQNGNDITVTIPTKEEVQVAQELPDGSYEISFEEQYSNEPYKITFKNGNPVKSKSRKQISGCKGFQLIEQAYSFNRAKSPEKNITIDEMEALFDADAQMLNLKSGHSREFICSVLEYRVSGQQILDKNNNITGRIIEPQTNIDAAISLIKSAANSENILLYASTLHKDSNAARVEKDLAPSYDLYSNHAYSIKGFNEELGLVYYTNPWNTNTIVEMDIYTFLDYINTITSIKVN